LWDPTTGVALRTLEGHTDWVWALAADPTGGWLASAGDDGTVRLWDPTTGAPLATLVGSADGWAALLPDGSYKLSGDPGGLWWVAGLCRFEPRELDNLAQFVSSVRRLPDDALIDHVR
jgi:WD40 repeat protein